MSRKVNNEAEFVYGSGQLNPRRSLSPGLAYYVDDFGYIQFSCHDAWLQLTNENGSSFSNFSLFDLIKIAGQDAINYPHDAIWLGKQQRHKSMIFQKKSD